MSLAKLFPCRTLLTEGVIPEASGQCCAHSAVRSLVDFLRHCGHWQRGGDTVRESRDGTFRVSFGRLAPVAAPLRRGFKDGTAQRIMSVEKDDSNSSRSYFGTTRLQSRFVFSGPTFVILIVMMVTLVVVIVLGNAMVILAFKVDKSLRRQCNYYFLNLAISDFLVGKLAFMFFME